MHNILNLLLLLGDVSLHGREIREIGMPKTNFTRGYTSRTKSSAS